MSLELTSATFDDAIKTGTVLVDFWAPWCGPCRMQAPILDQVAQEVGDAAKVAKVNVDEAQDIAAKFGVRSIPTLIIFKNGKEFKKFVGLQQAAALVTALKG
ncbi:MAG: thioredoxin [Lentisphaerae bacterium RIFOXYB12_FULL_65_16]|nr:MAG: thioredoxin [Lentisphaerae bacterium RIFOXYA12_64_32]OGV94372.1 MAG: thioredoxin [Lentisphaerae bacterium RIFOXYB12_FULL_65_16]